ncbi:hypothetical protein TSAR_012833 [Trichomalopsis sarcophagae]|uniref:EF-hand domain-containing protein n=1 Tax=Trichomalopsis sarcophagae TaxID=543379 RepID=A0A232EWY3_9HYME|nr:hypothetical protein TSAR_012833 [Trichomalopsis sarcophagae]
MALARKRRQFFGKFTIVYNSEYEEEQTPRYRPDSLASLCRATRFTEAEMKRIYRGFKAQCPTGVVREETFKIIYSQFFPQGGESSYCTSCSAFTAEIIFKRAASRC